MAKWRVYIGKQVAFDTWVEVEAASKDEAIELALDRDIPADQWVEGDWETGWHVQEVELDEEESPVKSSPYTSVQGADELPEADFYGEDSHGDD